MCKVQVSLHQPPLKLIEDLDGFSCMIPLIRIIIQSTVLKCELRLTAEILQTTRGISHSSDNRRTNISLRLCFLLFPFPFPSLPSSLSLCPPLRSSPPVLPSTPTCHHGPATAFSAGVHARSIRRSDLCERYRQRYRNKKEPSENRTANLNPSAILHTIFFHRYFIPIVPLTRDLLDQTLPAIDDVDLETLIDQRATSLVRAIERPADLPTVHPGGRPSYTNGSNAQSGRAQIAVQFFEKKRKKTYFSFGKGDEEICWEQWTLDVTCATPRTESGMLFFLSQLQ
jgi:hypothetical protein